MESLGWKSGNGKPKATVHSKHVFIEKYCIMDFITDFLQELLLGHLK